MSPAGAILGCDFAGTVAQVGLGITHFAIGARVAGVVQRGADLDPGAFAGT